MHFGWNFLVLLILGQLCVSTASPPVLTAPTGMQLRSDVSHDTASGLLGVSDPEGLGVTCQTDHVSQTVPFNIHLDPATAHSGYLLTISHSDQSTLTSSSYVINVQCTDDDGESATADVTVTISTNKAPVFSPHLSIVPVDEHVTALTSLFRFSVTDDEPFSLTWEVDPLSDSSYFTYDDASQTIKLASGHSFDYETKTTQFVITCTASDGTMRASSSVTITILDTNDPPYFQKSSVTVTVDEGSGGEVSFLPPYGVVDPDGDALTFSVVAGGTFSDHFSISHTDGTLTNVLELDRDDTASTSLSLQVEVKDTSGQSATIEVTVFLADINDNAPQFSESSYEFKVGLTSTKGSLVGTVDVTDKDDGLNAQLLLEVTKQSPPGYMSLEQNGRLYLNRDLDDGDYGNPFYVEVKATDGGNPALSSTGFIDVVWMEGPEISNLPETVYVAESVSERKPVFDLTVQKGDSDQYTCEQTEPTTDLFSVMDTGGKDFKVFFTGSGSLSASDVSRYQVTVRCYDVNGWDSKTLTIFVQPNTAPILTCDDINVDASTVQKDDEVHTIKVQDLENDPLEFSLTSSVFYVGHYSGVIKAKQSMRALTTDQFSLSLSVKDHELSADCSLQVFLTNVNEAPSFSNLDFTLEIPEDTAPGSALYTISVTDPNIYEATNIDLAWTSTDTDKYKFDLRVAGLEGTLKLADGVELDYESQEDRTMTLTFIASDGYLSSEEGTLTLKVTPVNEPPYFENNFLTYHLTFLEYSESAQEATLGGCHVIDPDEDDEVTLTLKGKYADLFSIADPDSCQLTLNSEYDLDEGAPDEVNLTLIASDKQGKKAEASITVLIEPVNDNTPEFEGPALLTVDHGTPAGEAVGKVEAKDQDVGTDGNLFYDIISEPDNSQLAEQYISFSSTGQFLLREPMDSFTTSVNFQYVVQVTDGGQPSRTATTTVNVVYDPTPTTTPDYNLTTTTISTQDDASEDSDPLQDPLVIGLVAALACCLAVLAAVGVMLCCKLCPPCGTGACGSCRSCGDCGSCCQSRPASPTNSLYPSRPTSPVRSNKISVVTLQNGYPPPSTVTAFDGRKVSAFLHLPPSHY
ncbi:protocadherin Fat 1-like [Babylonia areolata]|uniref:protocadherin Fat 1-like n=1 Tax=Babylonia areolata TaxID=304850 RepID=UPI003FD59B72